MNEYNTTDGDDIEETNELDVEDRIIGMVGTGNAAILHPQDDMLLMGTKPSSLHKKLCDVQGRITAIGKSGRNTHFKYDYSTEEDILSVLRPILAEVGLSISVSFPNPPTITEVQVGKSGKGMGARIAAHLTITDPDTGETNRVVAWGYGEDNADKAINKAMTVGSRYAYLKGFALPSSDDPERDSSVDEPKPVQVRPHDQKPKATATAAAADSVKPKTNWLSTDDITRRIDRLVEKVDDHNTVHRQIVDLFGDEMIPDNIWSKLMGRLVEAGIPQDQYPQVRTVKNVVECCIAHEVVPFNVRGWTNADMSMLEGAIAITAKTNSMGGV